MARIGESPRSSEGVSLKDVSPETNITTYTPDDSRAGKVNAPGTPLTGDMIGNRPFICTSSARLTPAKPAMSAIGRSLTPGTAESIFTIKGLNSLFDPFVESANARLHSASAAEEAQDANDLKQLSATAKDFHPNQLLIRDSVPDIVSSTPYPKSAGKKPIPKTPSFSENFDLYNDHSSPGNGVPSPRHLGLAFSTDGEGCRYVFIGNIDYVNITVVEIVLSKAGVYADMVHRVSKVEPGQPCALFLLFDDLRAAEQSYGKAVKVGSGMTIRYLNPLELDAHCPRVIDDCSRNLFAGQVHITAQLIGAANLEWDENTLRRACKALAGEYGEVRGLAEFGSGDNYTDYRVEFFQLSAAKRFVDAYGQGIFHDAYYITARHYMPSCAQKPAPQPMSRVDSGVADMMSKLNLSDLNVTDSGPVSTPQSFVPISPQNLTPYGWSWSPTGRTRIPRPGPVVPARPMVFGYPQANFMAMNGALPLTPRAGGFPGVIGEPPQVLTPNSAPWTSSTDRDGTTGRFGPRTLRQEHANGHHNTVNIDRIANGTDVRTTVMLRNIPNKMHLPDLKKFIDRSSYGKYDFIYLRIDFQNDCNVGYAFINFENSESIINFMLDINNKRWDEFRSWKVAEVSYATIQGKDCLIQKFRNSSVMKEFDGYRPKVSDIIPYIVFPLGTNAPQLYYTESDPQHCGQEAPFPEPDNWSKVKRSIDNAQHIGQYTWPPGVGGGLNLTRNTGLFPPRAGQQTRDEQRRRRSQFDRGTPRAQLEESFDRRVNFRQFIPNDQSIMRFGQQQPTFAGSSMYQY
ncbi:MAG: hypothetical protein Q9165_004645 [Trypethelium subeluteriae]